MARRAVARCTVQISCFLIVVAGATAVIAPLPAWGQVRSVIYVDDNAAGSNNGSSWTDAYTDVTVAMAAASAGDEIWVARGTYWMASGTLTLKNGVEVYGGFTGDETTVADRDPNPATNGTLISGGPGFTRHVVTAPADTDGSTVFDGFTVAAGRADAGAPNDRGAGMLVYGSPTLANLIIRDNTATLGAGMYVEGGSPTLTGVVFQNNTAYWAAGLAIHGGSPTMVGLTFRNNRATSFSYGGGGMHLVGGHPTLTGAVFSGNSAVNGGGLHVMSASPYLADYNQVLDTSLVMANVVFAQNSCANDGGGAVVSGGTVTVTNATMVGNQASRYGGGLVVESAHDVDPGLTASAPGAVSAVNSIIWGNTAASGDHQLRRVAGTLTVAFSDVKGSGGSAAWNVAGVVDGGGNIDAFPFVDSGDPAVAEDVDWDGSDGIFGTWDDGLRLAIGSAARDTGSNAAVAAVPVDVVGDPRIRDGDGDGTATVDMGAFESEAARIGVSYVNYAATGADDGSSWSDAFTDLQHALMVVGPDPTTQIWVAAGTYRPTVGTDRVGTFQPRNGVAVYGGFAGDETFLDQRDPVAHQTILSGDLVGDDGPGFTNRADNSYHVVSAHGWVDATAVMDGFTIRGGNANWSAGDSDQSRLWGGGLYSTGSPTLANLRVEDSRGVAGGGMYIDGGEPTLTGVVFSGNHGELAGGGVYLVAGDPTLTDVTFHGNDSGGPGGVGGSGGGMQVGDFNGYPVYEGTLSLAHVTFTNNAADFAGGLEVLSGDVSLRDVTFGNNTALTYGGGMIAGDPFFMYSYTGALTLRDVSFLDNSAAAGAVGGYYGGGMLIVEANATLVNVLFSGNRGNYGGGIAVLSGSPVLTNATFAGNTAGVGGAIWTSGSSTITNSILWGNSPDEIGGSAAVTYSIVEKPNPGDPPYPGTGNLNADPVFTSDLHLEPASPAIDAGNNAATGLVGVTTDRDGSNRIVDGDADTVATVDMGAYEYQPQPPTVTTSGATSVTGSTAQLNGSANPNGVATTGWFRYATTSPGTCNDAFGTRVPASGGASLGSGSSPISFSEQATGLAVETTYYVCAIAQSGQGTSFGSVISFATPPALIFEDGFEFGHTDAWSSDVGVID